MSLNLYEHLASSLLSLLCCLEWKEKLWMRPQNAKKKKAPQRGNQKWHNVEHCLNDCWNMVYSTYVYCLLQSTFNM